MNEESKNEIERNMDKDRGLISATEAEDKNLIVVPNDVELDLKKDYAGADLSNLDFAKLDLSNADLRRVNCDGATFIHVNLSGADLSGATFKGTRFIGTKVKNAQFIGASSLSTTQKKNLEKKGAIFTTPQKTIVTPVKHYIYDWQGNIVVNPTNDSQEELTEKFASLTVDFQVAKPKNAEHIVHRACRRQIANSKQKTASTKTRSEVRGGGRKPWRQKGTGRARAGSSRSPLWRGGGVIFGPKPKKTNIKMNRKERRLALRTAFQACADKIVVVEEFSSFFTKPKTKTLLQAIERWHIDPKDKILIILKEIQENVYLSGRNVPNISMICAARLNILELLYANKIIITTEAIAIIQEIYS